MAKTLRLVSLNVRGLRSNKKKFEIFRWVKDKKYDICLFQETFCTEDFKHNFQRGWKGKIIHSCSNSSHGRGVAILLREGLQGELIDTYSCENGRIALINIKILDTHYSIVNIYAPNEYREKIKFYDDVKSVIARHSCSNTNLLIGGDFNSVLSSKDRVSGKIDKSTEHLKTFTSRLSLFDVWKQLNEKKTEYTYFNPKMNSSNSRIDFWFGSSQLQSKCNTCSIVSSPAPDHKAIVLIMRLESKPRGKGYWKLNTELLKDPTYVDETTRLIEGAKMNNTEMSRVLLWEFIKCKIKEYSLAYSIIRATGNKNKEMELEKRLDYLDQNTDSGPTDSKEREKIRAELEEIYTSKSKGYQIRSRVKWVEKGEKSTKYFLNLENSRQTTNRIDALSDNSGTIKENDQEILKICKDFYVELYSTKAATQDKVDEYFEGIKPTKILSEHDKRLCEGEITIEECKRSVLGMKGNKAPGLDGLPIEWYKVFWNNIGGLLVSVFNESYEKESLCDSQQISVFSLIFKKGEKTDISNYRPISLTNVDYRILSSILEDRLQKVINELIDTDQTAYVKKRYIGNNIRLALDMIDHCKKVNLKGIMFLADFKKAFDSLEWNFIFKALNLFNFGQSFKNWIKMLYSSPKACIKNNGFLSDTFTLERGIRQGCQISALIFIICVEILAIKIRHSNCIQGFKFQKSGKCIKISQYADDCMLFLRNNNELCSAINILDNFGDVAGLRLNLKKCEGLQLGVKHHTPVPITQAFGIKWPQALKYLGIFIGNEDEILCPMNWDDKLNKIKAVLQSWAKRELSLFGKILVIKSLAISRVVMAATLLTVPNQVIKKLNSMVFSFIWGQRDKISRKKVIKPISKGGLGMVDIEKLFDSFKAFWLNRLFSSDNKTDSWAQIPNMYLRELIPNEIILNLNIDKQCTFTQLKNTSSFWREVIMCFSKVNECTKEHFQQTILSHQIWGNKFISEKRNGCKQVLFLRNWIRSGITYVRDLKFKNGILDCNALYNIIPDKRNLFIELQIIRLALIPYKHFLSNIPTNTSVDKTTPNSFCKSKMIYKHFIEKQSTHSNSMSKKLDDILGQNISHDEVFKKKLMDIKEIKLKEFNYKMLFDILPCNYNLKKWKLKESDRCDVCNEVQNVRHLLFECKYVKTLWETIEEILNCDITYQDVFCGFHEGNTLFANYLCSICSFIIYKEWLICSLKQQSRKAVCNLSYFKNELCFRLEIYSKAGIRYTD